MKTAFQKIGYFNEVIGNAWGVATPDQIDAQFVMIHEEYDELREWVGKYVDALRDGNKDVVAHAYKMVRDGMADVHVTVGGLAHRIAVDADFDLELVYLSNMSKFVTGTHGDAVLAALVVTQRTGLECHVRETVPGVWAIVSSETQVGIDGKTYPKGKLLKSPNFREPDFTQVAPPAPPAPPAKPVVEIRNARLVYEDGTRGAPVMRLVGEAKEHPRMGTAPVTTTRVVKFDSETGTYETRNTVYRVVGWM